MKALLVSSACVLLLPVSSCAGQAEGAGDGPGSGPNVVASVYPLEYVAQRLAGDRARVVDLVEPGQEPHDAELSVEQTAAVAEADLVLRVEGLAPALDEAVAQSGAGGDVEALAVLAERGPASGGPRPVRVLEGDPHFWLDPRALATYAAEVEERLVQTDPDQAGHYRRNGSALREDLAELDGRMSVGLEDCELRTVVVSHEAYEYLGYRYDLQFSSLVGLSPEDEPSPATLAALQDLVEDEGVTTVFYEPLGGPDAVQGLADDLDLEVAALDPLEGLTEDTADEDYLSIMGANLDALVEAGGCTGQPRS